MVDIKSSLDRRSPAPNGPPPVPPKSTTPHMPIPLSTKPYSAILDGIILALVVQ